MGTDINSIVESKIKNPIKIPAEAKPTQFWGKGFELENSIFQNIRHTYRSNCGKGGKRKQW